MEWLEIIGRVMSLVSISLLLIGVCLHISKINSTKQIYLLLYLAILLSCEIYGYLYRSNNLIVFWFSSIAHFFFLTLIFFQDLLKENKKLKYVLPLIGVIFVFFSIPQNSMFEEYVSKPNLVYDPLLILYALAYFERIFRENLIVKKAQLRLAKGVLLFFGLDFFLALSSNFLINESLYLVAAFWFLRAILLQFYYYTVIRYYL